MPAIQPPRAKRSRITRSADFDAVYQRGKSASNRHLVVYVFPREDALKGAPPRLGISVSKKVGGAVERNRIKRVLKEQFAQVEAAVPSGIDVVVIARPGCFEYLEEKGGVVLGTRLRELLVRVTGVERVLDATA